MANERRSLDIAKARHLWMIRRKPFLCRLAHRLVFLDETSTNAKLTKRTGCSPPRDALSHICPVWELANTDVHCRFAGQWSDCVHILDLELVNAPMNKQIFETYVETQLALTLALRDVVILDNVAFHKA